MEPNKDRKPFRWLAAAAFALIALAASAALISAQSPSPTPDATATPQATAPANGSTMSYEEFLADELSIPVDKLREAESHARDRYFDQLVQTGRLSPSDVALLQSTSPGEIISQIFNTGPNVVKDVLLSKIAGILGTDSATLKDELNSGKSLDQIAQEHNVNLQDVHSQIESQLDSIVEGLKQTGLVEDSQADHVRGDIEGVIDQLFDQASSTTAPGGATPTPTP